MISHRTAGLFLLIFTSLTGLSVIAHAQAKHYRIYRYQESGKIKESAASNAEQAIKLTPKENLAVVKSDEPIKNVKTMVPLQPNVVARRSFVLPETYYAKVQGTEAQVTLSPILNTDEPMKFVKSSGKFEGKLLVLLQEAGDNQSKKLTQPIKFSVVSEADNVSPVNDSIDHSYFPPVEIKFASTSPADSVRFTFITSSHPEGYKASLQVRPNLTIHTSETVLQGFGLERTTLNFSVKPPGSGPTHAIQVSPSLGTVDSTEIHLQGGQGSTGLRSGSLGTSKITVSSPDYADSEIYISYVFPFRFLIATLIGGIVGGIVRMKRKKHGLVFSLIVGMLWGLIVAVAWTGVGINLLNLPMPTFTNECVVFVLAAFAAIWGPIKQARV